MTSASISSSQQPGREPSESETAAIPPQVDGGLEGIADRPVKLHGREPGPSQPQITVGQLALRQIEAHAASNLAVELGGVLLGYGRQDNGRLSVEVMAALPVATDDHGPVHFTFTADSWAQIHQDRARRYPDLQIVGWFHTHPDLGVFYSADDVVVHSAAFVMPWHVGLVLDPVRGEGCFFGWRPPVEEEAAERPEADGELVLAPLPGFEERLDEQVSSVISWQLVPATIWQHGGYRPDGGRPGSQVYVPTNDWPSLPPINPWWGVILGGISLLVSLLLLLERILNALAPTQ
jgi:proteasome lid subunit RPN8/RPN11